MDEYADRQLNILLEKIDGFEKSSITISSLISDIDGIIRSLGKFDNKWIKNLHDKCFLLEQYYAVGLDEQKPLKFKEEILEEVNKIKTMVLTKKYNLPYNFPTTLLGRAHTLESIGLSELAWKYEDVIEVVSILTSQGFAILGGDVLVLMQISLPI